MTGRRTVLVLIRAGGTVVVALLSGLLVPSTASACGVGIGSTFDRSLRFGGDTLFGDTCSTRTSLSGVAVVTVLGVAVLTGLVSRAVSRSTDGNLESYLRSVGLGESSRRPPGETDARSAR